MRAQETKLMESLNAVVSNLDNGALVRSRLAELGKRHEKYGAKPEHYPIVCGLLMETMAKFAGPAWTAEIAAEWSQALQLVSEAMIGGTSMAPPGPATRPHADRTQTRPPTQS